jgi:hypothetical protein
MFFLLKSHIYATYCDTGIIILDAYKDKYFSLTDEAVLFLSKIITTEFTDTENVYFPLTSYPELENELFHEWILHFLAEGFIEPSLSKNTDKSLNKALKAGGLGDYQWDRKDVLPSFSQSPKLLVMRLLFLVMHVDFILKRKGIDGVLAKIEKYKHLHPIYKEPSQEQIATLSAALDVACSLYPKKIFCLAWASTLVLAAIKQGLRCNLVIGVQSPPFYAHAWAEAQGAVIHDSPQIQEYLSILLRQPFT